ncbi:hypothetical protein MYE70_10420 [Marinobacter alexandrii]|uniref:hypothetical protein n=1 Tax=Marinobacter alexandrii TaxID=2570351 RepID=UPI00200009B2|nr:hypothetical protein [Marinobacter alexandrii]MCK2149480.1 hypothetical protein [Marinobacter alexandrii]
MSLYEEQDDSLNAICPYCEYSYQVEGEDYGEDSQEQECDGCGKKFWLNQSFSVTHHTRPDCKINGEQHDWMLVELRNGKDAFFCQVCGECSLVSQDGTPKAEKDHA